MSPGFDAWSEDYERVLDEALEVTGFDAAHFVRYKLATLARLLPTLAGRPIELLDYGCGPGNLRAHLAEFFPEARYTGVDPSPAMIERARRRYPPGTEFHELDAGAWRERKFDLVFSAGVFHHIPHAAHARVLRELAGQLTAGGAIAIWEHNPRNPFTRRIVRHCAFDDDAVLVPAARLRRQLSEAALVCNRIVYVTFFPRALRLLSPLEPHLSWLPLGGQYVAIGEGPVPRR